VHNHRTPKGNNPSTPRGWRAGQEDKPPHQKRHCHNTPGTSYHTPHRHLLTRAWLVGQRLAVGSDVSPLHKYTSFRISPDKSTALFMREAQEWNWFLSDDQGSCCTPTPTPPGLLTSMLRSLMGPEGVSLPGCISLKAPWQRGGHNQD
jgi:hypothetical protein